MLGIESIMTRGSFSIELLIDSYIEIKNNGGRYLCCKDFKETARLETMEYNSSGTSTSVILTGRFLDDIFWNNRANCKEYGK